MSTRVWPYPDLRNGTTIHHMTDTHHGLRNETDERLKRFAVNMEQMRVAHAGHVHTGDMVDWDAIPTDAPEDAAYVSWRQQIRGLDGGKPWSEVVGNHDLQSFATHSYRTSAQWAASVGAPGVNTTTEMGGLWVIGLGPEQWRFMDGENSVLSSATLTYLDQQLTAAGSTPCVIATHVPPNEQYASTAGAQQPSASLAAIVGSHSNAVAWISGHRHANPSTDDAHVGIATIGGRRLFVVNGPAVGGGMSGSVYEQYAWTSPSLSMFISYLGDAIDVRWRDHLSSTWFTPTGTAPVRHLFLSAKDTYATTYADGYP